MNIVELIVGAILGTITSLAITELYHRRANKEMDRRLAELKELHDNLDAQLQDAVYFSEQAYRKGEEARLEAVKVNEVVSAPRIHMR